MIGPEQLSSIAETNFHQFALGRHKSGCLKKLPKPPSSNVNAFRQFSYGRLAAIAAWIAAWPVVKEWIR